MVLRLRFMIRLNDEISVKHVIFAYHIRPLTAKS